jgi:hypothetical protein
MTLRHILEFEDHEIMDLLGDLEGVGHADKMSFALWVSIPDFKFTTNGYSNRINILVALGDSFYSGGSLKSDKAKMLRILQEGKFIGPTKDGLNWKTLKGNPNPQDPGRRRSQEVINLLDGPSLLQFFKGEENLDTALLNLNSKIESIVYDKEKMKLKNTPSVGIVYGTPGDEDLLIIPSESFRQTLFYHKGLVFYEDLRKTKDSRTFPFA